jgi:hypothetical protein
MLYARLSSICCVRVRVCLCTPSPAVFVLMNDTHLIVVVFCESAHAPSGCRSRLGCQIIVSKDLEGMVLQLPQATRNMAVDGYRPKPH